MNIEDRTFKVIREVIEEVIEDIEAGHVYLRVDQLTDVMVNLLEAVEEVEVHITGEGTDKAKAFIAEWDSQDD